MSLFKKLTTQESPSGPVEEKKLPIHHLYGFVHEVDPGFLLYMAKRYEQQTGKFVRVGDMVLVGPLEERWGEKVTRPMHAEYIELALKSKNSDFKQRLLGAQAVAASNGERLLSATGIRDAGMFSFTFASDNEIAAFRLYGESLLFGRGDDEVREETAAIVRQKLGPKTQVISSDYQQGGVF